MKVLVNFLRDKKASITVEMVGIFGLFVLLIALISDVGSSLVTQTRINNLSYSLASLIRERSDLYVRKDIRGKNIVEPDITDDEANDLYEVAKRFMNIKDKGSSIKDMGITFQSLSFNGLTSDSKEESTRKSISKGKLKCEPTKDIKEFADLSFFTKAHKWASLYQVTVCVQAKGNFAPKISEILISPVSNSIVYGR